MPVKRVVGDELLVTADIFADGHDLLDAALLAAGRGRDAGREAPGGRPMRLVDNDRWSGSIRLDRNARHRYTIEAWRDGVRQRAPRPAQEGGGRVERSRPSWPRMRLLLRRRCARPGPRPSRRRDATLIADGAGRHAPRPQRCRPGRRHRPASELLAAVRRHPDRSAATRSAELPLVVDRERARFGAWYELFPRSQGRDPARPAATTFDEATWRLPEIARLGFDVVYLPPIHPIGRTNRKGAQQHPEAQGRATRAARRPSARRTEATTRSRRSSAGWTGVRTSARRSEAQGMEVALDLAIQASPDHPWVRQHPDWFSHAPDGTIKYAENPPKRYQDIYPIDVRQRRPGARRRCGRPGARSS